MRNLVQESHLLFLGLDVVSLKLVEFPDEMVYSLPVFADSVEALLLHPLLFDLNLLVLVLQISELVFQLAIIPLPSFELLDLSLEFSYEKLLVLAHPYRRVWAWWRLVEGVSEGRVVLVSYLELSSGTVDAKAGLELILSDLIGLIGCHRLVWRSSRVPWSALIFFLMVKSLETVLLQAVLGNVVS